MTIDILRQIFIQYLNLNEDRVNIWNQKYTIPDFDGMFITLEYLASKVYANTAVATTDNSGNYVETVNINVQEIISISMFSRNFESVVRRYDIAMALGSNLSIQLQQQYGFKIAQIASPIPVNTFEPTALLYRFDTSVTLLSAYSKTQAIDYYNSMNVSVIDDGGNPLLTSSFTQPVTQPIT